MPMAQNLSRDLDTLPIPPATVVIDMRDAGDEVLEAIQGEVYNLFHEMNMGQADHWRYLTDFIAFRAIPPLSLEDVEMLRETEQAYVDEKRSLTGRYHPGVSVHGPDKYYTDDYDPPSLLDSVPHDEFRRNLDECKALINTVRNLRFKAVKDMGNTGRIGGHKANSKVQVIILTDEQKIETLASASAYAVHLKKLYSGTEETGLPMLDTMIICLNHDNQAEPPKRLIKMFHWQSLDNPQEDEWKHIDALYLVECIGHNGVYISPEMQPDIAELLIYSLLLAPPRPMRPAAPNIDSLLLPPPKQRLKESKSLPLKTYIVGLSAIEHSTRWGRHFLNYGLAAEVISILQEKRSEDQATVNHTADAWLRRWRLNVRSIVPDQLLGLLPTLQQAFSRCEEVAISSEGVTTVSNLTLDTGDKTAQKIEQYVDAVSKTYTLSLTEQETLWKEASSNTSSQTQATLTLQDALDSSEKVQQQLGKWQEGDPEPPLIKALKDVQGVLSHPDFFKGPRGAVPRAKLQLSELSKLVRGFQNEHKKEVVNLGQRRQELLQLGEEKIKEVAAYATRFPFFAGFLRLKGLLTWLTLVLVIALGILGVFIGLGWFHHLLITVPDLTGLALSLDRYGLLGASFYTLIIWAIALAVVAGIILGARRAIFDKRRSALWVEIYFLVALIAFPVLGWIVSLAAGLDTTDPASYVYFSGLSRLPFWSTIVLFMALFILLVEVIYYFVWHNGLVSERQRIVGIIRGHQGETINKVKQYLADEVALVMLRYAGLSDGNGNAGPYYYRIDQLYNDLEALLRTTEKEHKRAKQRLSPQDQGQKPMRGATNSTKTSPVKIRITVPESSQIIATGKRLRNDLVDGSRELTDFAELLLRIMGEEEPILIEQQLNERPITIQALGEQSFQHNSEQHEAQLLLSTIVSLSLRADRSKLRPSSIAPLAERYHNLDYRVADEFAGVKELLASLQLEISKDSSMLLDAHDEDQTKQRDLSTNEAALPVYALEVWSQTLWEQKDPEVDKLLDSGGLVQYLERNDYDPQTVKSLLGASTIIAGRSRNVGQQGELSLLLYPSRQGRSFFEDMHLESRFVGIPDAERIILLYIHQYVAPPVLTTEPEPESEPESESEDIAQGNASHNGHMPPIEEAENTLSSN